MYWSAVIPYDGVLAKANAVVEISNTVANNKLFESPSIFFCVFLPKKVLPNLWISVGTVIAVSLASKSLSLIVLFSPFELTLIVVLVATPNLFKNLSIAA